MGRPAASPRKRALTPAVIHAGFRLLAPVLRERRIVGIAFGPTAIVSCRVFATERTSRTEPLRQIRIGQELAAEGNQIRLARAIPPRCRDRSRRPRSASRDI